MSNVLDLKAENNLLKRKIEKLNEELNYLKSKQLNFNLIAKIFENTGMGIVVHDFTKILFVNEVICKKFSDVDSNCFVGNDPMSFVHEKFREIVSKRMEQLKKGEPAEAIEETYVLPNGQTIDVYVGSFPIVHEGKTCALLTISDLTKQKKISSKNELLIDVLENVPVSLIIANKNLEIEYVNSYFHKLTGYSKKEIMGKSLAFVLGQTFNKDFLLKIYKKVSSGGVWTGVLRNKKKNGELFWDDVRVKAIFNEDGIITNYFSVHTDITEKMRLNEELKLANENLEMRVKKRTEELEEQTASLMKMQKAITYVLEDVNNIRENLEKTNIRLEESNKNLESFTYTVSHDLKNPIINIRDLVRFFSLKYENTIDEEGRKMLVDIQTSSEKVVDLITHLLKFVRTGIEKPDIVEIEMEPLVKSIFSEEKNNLNMDNARLKTGKLFSFEGDYPLIKQVVANLISNALKFSVDAQIPTVSIDSKLENDNVIYTFSDNGIGFDDKIKDKIFGIFYRSNQAKDYKGTGIGLAIVKKIINKHGGEITAESKPGEGAVFTFTLPIKSKIKV